MEITWSCLNKFKRSFKGLERVMNYCFFIALTITPIPQPIIEPRTTKKTKKIKKIKKI